eukprot:symbB.v1.2.020332.t1/scaffold1705.1/size105345/5
MTSLCRRVLNHVALDVQDDRAADRETVSATVDVTVNSVTVRWMAQLPVEPQSKVSMTTTLTSPKGGQAEMSSAATVSAGPDGVVSGVSRFHFLLPSQEYILSLYAEGSPEPLLRRSATTERCGKNLPFQMALMVPSEMWMTYVGVEHDLGEWLGKCPEDMVWTVKPSFELMRELWRHGCFTLPSPGSLVTQCPNPISRYCLDLKQQQPWLRSKKVKRHRGDFRLTVNGDYRRTFKECEKVHLENHRSTWITPELVEGLDRCRREAADLKVYSIELWEKSTGTLAAAIMGLSMGDVFHDYTMATMLRDDRSPGAILTKVVGHLLVEAGYTLWYWGYKNPYMAEYDGRYGGVALNNEKDFWPRWQNAMNLAGAGQLGPQVCPDLAQRVPSKGLDLALDL